MIQKPERELPLEEVLKCTFNIYSRNVKLFFIPNLLAALVSGFLGVATFNFVTAAIAKMPGPHAPLAEMQRWFFNFLIAMLAVTILMGIIMWIVNTVVQGVCVKCAADLLEKGSTSLGEALNYTVYKLLPLLLAALITGILIGLGILALIVPGIILAIMFSLVVPAIIIEGAGALDSLSRSRRLVSHRWLKTFALLLIVFLIVGFASYVGTLIGQPLGPYSMLVGSIIAAFIQPVFPISITVYYYTMLAKDAQMAPPPPPPPPF